MINKYTKSGSLESIQSIIRDLGREKIQEIIHSSQSLTNLCKNLGISTSSKYNVFRCLSTLGFDMNFKKVKKFKPSKVELFSKEELQERLNTYNNWFDFCGSLGYSGKNRDAILKVKKMGLDTSYIDNYKSSTRSYEKEELESAINQSSLWQEVYRNFKCRSNEEINNLKKYIELYDIDTSHLQSKTAKELFDSYSDEDLINILSDCTDWKCVSKALGFKGTSVYRIREYIGKRNLKFSFKENHNPGSYLNKIKERPVKDLIKVVQKSKNWKNLIGNINEEYGTFYDSTTFESVFKYINQLNIDTSHFELRGREPQVSNEEFLRLLKESTSWDELMRKLGFKSGLSRGYKFCKEKVKELNASINHFTFLPVDINFSKKELEEALKKSTGWYNTCENLGLIPSGHIVGRLQENVTRVGINIDKIVFDSIKSRGELFTKNFLEDHGISYMPQKRFPDCKHKYPLPFDFYLPDQNICIEFQGEQHFKPIDFEGCNDEEKIKENFKNTIIRDNIKRNYCKSKGIPLVEITNIEEIPEKLAFLL